MQALGADDGQGWRRSGVNNGQDWRRSGEDVREQWQRKYGSGKFFRYMTFLSLLKTIINVSKVLRQWPTEGGGRWIGEPC